ncbi:hypothetical protein Tco_0509214 [Tanacetum coccineum]
MMCVRCFSSGLSSSDIRILRASGLVTRDGGSVEGCSTARLQMKVAFDQARKEEASFTALIRELCCSLRVSLSKKRRLTTELEGLEEQGDAVRALENMKEIVACDSVMLGDLEQVLARAQVGVDLKDGYLADVEENV